MPSRGGAGLVVAAGRGHRCAALHRLGDGAALTPWLLEVDEAAAVRGLPPEVAALAIPAPELRDAGPRPPAS